MRAPLITLTLLAAACSETSQQPPSKPSETAGPSTYLASISIPLGDQERLQSFQIETWGVRFLAVCRIPPGWRVMAGGSAAPDSLITGTASHGVTWLKDMKPLQSLVLVRLDAPVRRDDVGAVPATFRGKAVLDAGDDNDHERSLTHANVKLTAADHCPPVDLTN